MRRLLRRIFDFPITLLYSNVRTVNEKSYYPDLPRKSWLRRWFECAIVRWEDGEHNGFYNLYGMDVRGDEFSKRSRYLLEGAFWNHEIRKNYIGPNGDWSIVLRNKYLFWMCMKGIGIPTPEIVATSEVGFDNLEPGDYFFKVVDGECARGVARIHVDNSKSLNLPFSSDCFCIAQRPVLQHIKLAAFNPSSVNTLRIVTLRTDLGIRIIASGLRMGCGNLPVDNWAAGGIFVGVDVEGRCLGKGFFKPKFGKGVITEHPISKIVFEGYQIPFWKQIVELVKKAHSHLIGLKSIGWDVAVTPDGPLLIEGNDNYEISLMQAVHGGLRAKYE